MFLFNITILFFENIIQCVLIILTPSHPESTLCQPGPFQFPILSLSQITHQVQFILPVCGGLPHRTTVSLPGTTSLKKMTLSSPGAINSDHLLLQGCRLVGPFGFHAGMLVGLILCRSLAGIQSFCELLSVAIVQEILCCFSPSTSDSCSLSMPSSFSLQGFVGAHVCRCTSELYVHTCVYVCMYYLCAFAQVCVHICMCAHMCLHLCLACMFVFVCVA